MSTERSTNDQKDYSHGREDIPGKGEKPQNDARILEQQERTKKRQEVLVAVRVITEGYEAQDATIQSYQGPLMRALKEERGSVTKEHDDLLEPLADMSELAFWIDQKVLGPEVVSVLKNKREKALQVLEVMFERYPPALDFTGRAASLDRSLGKLKKQIDQSFFGFFLSIDSKLFLDTKDGSEDKIGSLLTIDRGLRVLTQKILDERSKLDLSVDDLNRFHDSDEDLKDRVSSGLILLKNLQALRQALCKECFGQEKNPEEVIAIHEKTIAAQEIAGGNSGSAGKKSETPVIIKPEIPKAKIEKKPVPSFKEVADLLNEADIKNPVEDARKLVTPEVKAALFKELSALLDGRLDAVKNWKPGQKLDLQNMGVLIGISAEQKIYRLPLIAAEGKMANVRKTKIVDYFQQVFGHDLSKDRRVRALTRSTNIFE
ncbi:MAG: hypothetical protein UX09_C0068G0004 [Candidatus Uhrbacteria bacterium GW2011_GWE2_45_35]|uniref:Uncharacterized protein n=1 Tax=Candidatus Uhrbacteria bacterium GW2011_GWE2_45_35 TaxID=1618993 RepID=A0A0G1MBR9_9BACT|nr:MAG: hypothetical protein UX09_C0068G0004 [Candidatus Uhrbacteria bacterium GW2011_GWE2_45_35]HBR80430.1 hypothetical protein [Candidatus Uhrbacteria bacterium]HCU31193.1 hypothetical protein [Candidatus Uhrbacteria bacterium]